MILHRSRLRKNSSAWFDKVSTNGKYSIIANSTPFAPSMDSGQTFYDGCQVPPSFFSGCLAHLLSSDVSQVEVFIVGLMISPHDKNNLEPLRSQSSKGLRMAVPFAPLVAIVFVRPLTSIERVKRKPVRGVAQQLITGKTKLYDT